VAAVNGAVRKVCLLTGASGRLGTAFCRRHAATYDIVALYRRAPPPVRSQFQRVVDPLAPQARLEENRAPVFALQADLLQAGAPEAVINAVVNRFGRIDAVVHAAVVYSLAPITDCELADSAADQLAMNVTVPLRLVAHAVRRCWRLSAVDNRRANRSVVLVSSTSARKVCAGQGQSVYAAAKAGMNQLGLHLASELTPLGIRAMTIAPDSFPGRVPTDWIADQIATQLEGSATGGVLTLDRETDRDALTRG
jgi:NAD(P)-dependent dehydrogenase (short-subunit alcohol dehydrogenase family)